MEKPAGNSVAGKDGTVEPAAFASTAALHAFFIFQAT
jgi:hypothetical protein